MSGSRSSGFSRATALTPSGDAEPAGPPEPVRVGRGRSGLTIRAPRGGWWFVVLLGVVAVLVLLPIVAVIFGSLRTGSPGAPGATFTLDHWSAVYAGPAYLGAFLNTLVIALPVTILSVGIGLAMAWAVVRTDLPGHRWLDVAVIIPQFLSPFTTTLAWIILASPRSGMVNVLLQRFGWAERPIFDVFSVAGIVWVMVLIFVPYVYLTVSPALRSLDPALEDVSYTTGAGFWTTLRRVTLPMIMPTLFSSGFLVFIFSMEMFIVPALLGAPIRYYNLPYLVYSNTVNLPPNYGQAAAAGTMLLWVAIAAGYIYRRLVRESHRYVTITGKGFRPRRLSLGRWRYLALAGCLAYLAAGLVIPYIGLLIGSFLKFLTPRITPELLTFANYQTLVAAPEAQRSMWNTLLLVTTGPTLGIILALFISYALVRLPIPGRGLLDYLINLPIAVPAIVLGIGLLWVYAYLPLPIFGTILALALAYQTRYLIFPVRSASNGFLQIHHELEEAARVTGASTVRLLRDIVAPLLAPALLAGWSIMFVLILREINMTILLYTPATQPIALLMWEYTSNGVFTAAAALGIVQTLVILIALVIVRRLARTEAVAGG